MNSTQTVDCPFCGEANEVVVDPTQPSHTFVTDCEVCCRPFEVRVEVDPDSADGEPIVSAG